MPSVRQLLHPEMLARLERTFFLSRCTIQTYSAENADTYGQPQPVWSNFAGHVAMPCAVAGVGETGGSRETKREDMTVEVNGYTISIAGCYPTIQQRMRAVVGSTVYDILGVVVDSHSNMTRLTVRLANP